MPDLVPTYRPPVPMPSGARWASPPFLFDGGAVPRDGRSRPAPGHIRLFVVSLGSGAARQLTPDDVDVDGAPAWSPTGAAIVFSSREGDLLHRSYMTARLFRVPAAGGAATAITPEHLGARDPAFSPDGTRVAFVAALVVVPDAGHGSIGGTPSRLIATTAVTLDWFARHGGEPQPTAFEPRMPAAD